MEVYRVLGVPCPWSGDEHDRIPRSYWVWVWCYQRAQRLRHRVGLHHGRVRPLDPGSEYCDWCGARRRLPSGRWSV